MTEHRPLGSDRTLYDTPQDGNKKTATDKIDNCLFYLLIWRAWKDSNLRPLGS